MRYTRSSFLKYLTKKKDCEIINLGNNSFRVITIKNGSATAYIHTTSKDVIDYDEIFIVC